MESKLVHISLHNVSSFPVTRDLTLNIAKLSPSLLSTWPDLRHILCSLPALAMVMSDGQAPGADHRPVSQLTLGHHNINRDNGIIQLDTNRLRDPETPGPGPPTTAHNGPLASWSVLLLIP